MTTGTTEVMGQPPSPTPAAAGRRGRKALVVTLLGLTAFAVVAAATVPGSRQDDQAVRASIRQALVDGGVRSLASGPPAGLDLLSADGPTSTTSPTTTTVATTTTEAPTTTVPVPTTTTTAPPPPPTTAPPPPPEPAPETTAAPAPEGSAEEAIYAWFPDVFEQARSVAQCESGMNPNAVSSGGGNHGLFQINNVHRDNFTAVTGAPFDPGVYDPYLNSEYARYLYNQSGWGPWACKP